MPRDKRFTRAKSKITGGRMRLDRSKLFEWLLDNECPYDWDVDEKSSNDETVTLIFSEDT